MFDKLSNDDLMELKRTLIYCVAGKIAKSLYNDFEVYVKFFLGSKVLKNLRAVKATDLDEVKVALVLAISLELDKKEPKVFLSIVCDILGPEKVNTYLDQVNYRVKTDYKKEKSKKKKIPNLWGDLLDNGQMTPEAYWAAPAAVKENDPPIVPEEAPWPTDEMPEETIKWPTEEDMEEKVDAEFKWPGNQDLESEPESEAEMAPEPPKPPSTLGDDITKAIIKEIEEGIIKEITDL